MLIERYKEGSSTILADKINSGAEITLNDLIDAIQKEDVLSIEIWNISGLILKSNRRINEYFQSGIIYSWRRSFIQMSISAAD